MNLRIRGPRQLLVQVVVPARYPLDTAAGSAARHGHVLYVDGRRHPPDLALADRRRAAPHAPGATTTGGSRRTRGRACATLHVRGFVALAGVGKRNRLMRTLMSAAFAAVTSFSR